MQIQLSWIDPNTEERREPLFTTPVAIGKNFEEMPAEINDKLVSRVVIADDLVAGYHVLITEENQRLIAISQDSNMGMKINSLHKSNGSLKDGDRLQVGNCEIVVNLTATNLCDRMVGFLFKRRCDRTDQTDCPYCYQSYEEDYAFYSGYGNYRSGYWGDNYYDNRDGYFYDPSTGNVNFTEADAISLERESDGNFEYDMGAS
ncbi:FHA domain-containing protein [Nodularia sp. UHCC 0506]|uniref:FHA domain-containing protein n=1 Tax=Nodularia sp. UHCC 0506 TaxID=3110243 RepID=UPI002B1F18EA|nr:FHA domain-containing protein [Nodularia sp. UHCC 0506]MEA5515510.1 FHA domain-containing protein [Nodularia sp. UHCC 0506]